MYTSYPFIDASTEGHEEEEVFYEEEEENFDYCTNQGKLLLMQAFTNASYILASYPNAKLYESKAPLHFYLMSKDPTPSFILASLYFAYQSLLL